MFTKETVQELAKDMGIKISGLENVPKLHQTPVLFELGDNLYEADNHLMNIAEFENGKIQPLAGVSSKYAFLQYFDVIGEALQAYKDIPEFAVNSAQINMMNQGGRMQMELFSDQKIEIAPKDFINIRNILIHSADCSKKFWWLAGAIRGFCSNGMIWADDRFENLTTQKKHHTGSLNFEEEVLQFKTNYVKVSESLELWKKYAELEMKKDDFLPCFEAIGISDKQGEEVMSLTGRGDNKCVNNELLTGAVNGWTAYNAITQFLTDNVTNPMTQVERGMKATKFFNTKLEI
jgi:hypothetical protein